MDNTTLRNLLKMGFFSVGSRRSRVFSYRPIIRCDGCKLYGHSVSHCKIKLVCAYCAMRHSTPNCTNTTQPKLKNCTNCLNTKNYQPHTADSPLCPTFISLIKNRNNISNSYMDFPSGSDSRI